MFAPTTTPSPLIASKPTLVVERYSDLGNYKLLTAKMGNLTIKSKINRETEVPSHNVKLYIPAEKCCVYEDNKLI